MKQKFKDVLSKVLILVAKGFLAISKGAAKVADKIVATAEKLSNNG